MSYASINTSVAVVQSTILIKIADGTLVKLTVSAHALGGFIDFNIITDCQPECGDRFSGHPFALCRPVRGLDGRAWMTETVADNDMTRQLFRHIAMPDEELAKWSGTTMCGYYRAQLLDMLKVLMD